MQNRQISIENIQKTVADYYKIKVSEMYSKKRSRNVARPRQIAMALAKELTQLSLPDIGEAFGGRDHTTVLHACRKIADLRSSQQRHHARRELAAQGITQLKSAGQIVDKRAFDRARENAPQFIHALHARVIHTLRHRARP